MTKIRENLDETVVFRNKEIEDRRREGMKMLKKGIAQIEVARMQEVSRQTVSRWAKMLDGSPEPWRQRPLGRPSGLSEAQRVALIWVLADNYDRRMANGEGRLDGCARG